MPVVTEDFDLANLALDHLHITQKIGSLDDATEPARAAKRWYEITRQAMLRARDWSWRGACKRETLVEDTDTAHKHPHWAKAFVPPVGMLKPRGFLVAGYRNVPGDWLIPYKWENTPDGIAKRIYTDLTGVEPIFAYTPDVKTVASYPEMYATALSYALALRMAVPLRVNPEIVKTVTLGWRMAWIDACSEDTTNEQPDPPPDASWILVRN